MIAPSSRRIVHCTDALAWLESQSVLAACSFITSLPDISEFPSLTLAAWQSWFIKAAKLILSRCPDDGVVVFFQTDIKFDGTWVDKGYLCQIAAEQEGHKLLWHKIVCRKEPGTITFGRPGYSHMLCFSKGIRLDLARSKADVMPQAGETVWTRGMGLQACLAAGQFIKDSTASKTIVAPFCGFGTALAVANFLDLDAIGIELSVKRARKARVVLFNGGSLSFGAMIGPDQ